MTKTLVLVPILKNNQKDNSVKDETLLAEINSLAKAINLNVQHSSLVVLTKPRSATLFGSGKIAELCSIINELSIELVIVDHNLTPVQQSNLEKSFKIKVIDRTALILEIFGARAKTKEGTLQVELAHLTYQKSRLIRSWTHLERQRGGTGFMGGPGEKQIEADKRHLQDKINSLKKQLSLVVKTRELHRKNRKKKPYPIVALVGYTNAGKSTLFNKITSANVLAKDMLFATLDPTLRKVMLPSGNQIIVSDTVGFIANLPIMLIAAFRATLEEVCEADLILHVRDISNVEHNEQKNEVYKTLKYLNIDVENSEQIIEVWNKIDLLDQEHKKEVQANIFTYNSDIFPISAETGENVDNLLMFIDKKLYGDAKYYKLELDLNDLNKLDEVYIYGRDISRKNLDTGAIEICGKFTQTNATQLAQKGIVLEKI